MTEEIPAEKRPEGKVPSSEKFAEKHRGRKDSQGKDRSPTYHRNFFSLWYQRHQSNQALVAVVNSTDCNIGRAFFPWETHFFLAL